MKFILKYSGYSNNSEYIRRQNVVYGIELPKNVKQKYLKTTSEDLESIGTVMYTHRNAIFYSLTTTNQKIGGCKTKPKDFNDTEFKRLST